MCMKNLKSSWDSNPGSFMYVFSKMYKCHVSLPLSQGQPLYYGTACECDDSRCPRTNGEICSNRGQCTCDGCDCNIEPNTQQRYFGQGCECTPNTNCIDPQNRTVSSIICLATMLVMVVIFVCAPYLTHLTHTICDDLYQLYSNFTV